MKLTLDILYNEFQGQFSCEVLRNSRNNDPFDAVFIYTDHPDEVFPPDASYLFVSLEQLLHSDLNESSQVILCEALTEDAIRGLPYNIVAFSEDQDPIRVFNTVSRIADKYNRWEDSLRGTLHAVGTLDDILEASSNIFDNLLFVIDSSFRFRSANRRVDNKMVSDGLNAIEMKVVQSEFSAAHNIKEPRFFTLEGYPTACYVNMFNGDFYMGMVCLAEDRSPIRSCDPYLLQILARNVRKAFLLYSNSEPNPRSTVGNMLVSLLTGKDYDKEYYYSALGNAGIRANDEFYCLAMRTDRKRTAEFNQYFIERASAKLPIIHIPLDDDFSYAIIDDSYAKRKGLETLDILEEELRSNSMRAAVSSVFTDLNDLEMYIQQARNAAQIGAIKYSKKPLVTFDECWLQYVLNACISKDYPQKITLQPPGFSKLLEHDENSPVSYIDTLRAYLFNNMNALKAAQSLYITRNAFMLRMDKINEILGMDLDDPIVRFRLMFCLFSLGY